MKVEPQFNFDTFSIEDIKTETEKLLFDANEANESKGLLTIKNGNRWIEQAKTRPIPKMLFGALWFESEMCILFADTNVGKSILAVQIGDSISKGEQIPGFTLEAKKQPILYCDFELSDKQFENRYSIKFDDHYIWDKNFLRSEIDPNKDVPDGQNFEDYLNYSLERTIIDYGIKVLIIDNLTFLKDETEKAKDALPLMKHLKALKNKYGLSLLILAHTPKRDLSKPITRNDLSGSKMLINFCDSSFSIGESSSDKNLRYIKQIKSRNTEQIYDADNVCVCQIDKPHNFLLFDFVNYGKEWEHLKQHTEKDNDNQSEKVIELVQKGRSYREIGIELGMSHMKAKRIFDKNNNL